MKIYLAIVRAIGVVLVCLPLKIHFEWSSGIYYCIVLGACILANNIGEK